MNTPESNYHGACRWVTGEGEWPARTLCGAPAKVIVSQDHLLLDDIVLCVPHATEAIECGAVKEIDVIRHGRMVPRA